MPSIDLLDEEGLERAALFAAAMGGLRLVLDATGFFCDDQQGPGKSWRQLDPVKLARPFALNGNEAYAAAVSAVGQNGRKNKSQ